MSNSPTAAPPGPQAPAEFLLQMATGYMVSSALQVVTKLEVADQFAGGPRAVEDIAAAVGADADALYRVMRALFDKAGFELTRIVPNKSPLSAVEARVKT